MAYISLHDVKNMNCWESKMFQKFVQILIFPFKRNSHIGNFL